jgi:hypothetical protein
VKELIELIGVDEGRALSLQEYLSAIPDEHARHAAGALLDQATISVRAYASQEGRLDEFPEFRVVNDAVPNAEGMPGLIRITHGMIDHVLTVDVSGLAKALDLGPLEPHLEADPLLPRRVMIDWVVLHEFNHSLRRHNEALGQLGDDPLTLQAVEMDADLVAIARVYRSLQAAFSRSVPDILLRQFAQCCAFWLLRTLTTFCRRSTHSPLACRMIQLHGKLAMLPEPVLTAGLPDVKFERPESRERSDALSRSLKKAELAFQSMPSYLPEFGNLIAQVIDELRSGEFLLVSVS